MPFARGLGSGLLLAGTLCGCPLGECPPDTKGLADGDQVNGLAPDAIVSPLTGEHVATLTWLVPQRTTLLHLDVEKVATTTVLYDCEDNFEGFEVSVRAHLFTDDGLVDATLESTQNTTLEIDPAGHIADPQWSWSLNIDPLRSAGVVDASVDGSFVAKALVRTELLQPIDGSIQASSFARPNATPILVGTFAFGM